MKRVAFNESTKEFKCSFSDGTYCLNQLPGEKKKEVEEEVEEEEEEEKRNRKKGSRLSVPFDFGRKKGKGKKE